MRELSAEFKLWQDDDLLDEKSFTLEGSAEGDLHAETSSLLTSMMQYLKLLRRVENMEHAQANAPDDKPDLEGSVGF